MRDVSRYSLLLALVVAGCKRESRTFESPAAMSTAVAVTHDSGVSSDYNPRLSEHDLAAVSDVDPFQFERNGYNLGEGQTLFTQMNCNTCHAANGGGDIGPTLTDDRWIYGSEPRDVFETILRGRPNGMPAYGTRLSPTQIWQLTAFVRSLGGLVPKTIAPGRQDTMQLSVPPNSAEAPSALHAMPSAGTTPR